MTNTTRTLADTDQHDLPLDQGDATHAANAALFEGKRALEEAREAWAEVKEAFDDGTGAPLRSIEQASRAEALARRLAVRLEQAAGKTLGLVSSSACGLWGVDDQGRIFQVDATNGGSDYLNGVRFVRWHEASGAISLRDAEEFPVRAVAAFFDTFEDAREWLEPAPPKTFLGR